jgi:hypothetical protein
MASCHPCRRGCSYPRRSLPPRSPTPRSPPGRVPMCAPLRRTGLRPVVARSPGRSATVP